MPIHCRMILVSAFLLCVTMPGRLASQTPEIRTIVNWATLQPGPLVPGSIFVISGVALSRSVVFAPPGQLPIPTTLGETTVRMNGTPVPLLSVLSKDVTIQVPWELAGQRQASVVVTSSFGTSAPFTVPVATYAPSIFEGAGHPLTGNAITIIHPDLTPVSINKPAKIGQSLSVFGVGFGPVNDPPPTGAAAGPSSATTTVPKVAIGAVAATVQSSGLMPGFVGLYRINLQVSASTPSGTEIPLMDSIDGVVSANTAFIPVETAPPTIRISQTGLLFTGVEGGGAPPAQSFSILNVGQGTMSWSAQSTTVSGGNWLSVSPASGASTGGSTSFPAVTVNASLAGLAAGSYTGQIRVTAPTAANSPQSVTVVLRVLSRGSNPGIVVQPTGLIFATQAGASSPGSQSVTLATSAPGNLAVTVTPATTSGGNWLNANPRSLTLSPGAPQAVTVQTTLGALAADVYSGTLTFAFSDGSPPQVVNALFLVTTLTSSASAPSLAGLAGRPFATEDQAAQCVPQRVLAVNRLLGNNFQSPVAWPTVIEILVTDNCGAVPNATVVASFSNGDPPLVFSRLGNGIYTGTWRPLMAAAQVRVMVQVNAAPLAPTSIELQGQVTANPLAPALFSGGTVNGATFAAGAVAPGTIITVFGRNLAPATAEAAEVPLPTRLRGTSLSVAGVDVPLFFANNGQINAQLPFELPSSGRQQIVVRTGLEGSGPVMVTVPETITIVPAAPGIFMVDPQQGTGAILHAENFQLVSETSPARPGEFVLIFATGLGALNRPTPSGTIPTAPVPETVERPQVVIADLPAQVTFSGLAPCCVGLYQVNAQVPAGAPAGLQPLQLTIRGASSNTVKIAVR